MRFLLDTNVISELVKPLPNENVWEWVNALPDEQLFISSITIGELQRGIELLPPSIRRSDYERWLQEQILTQYADRIIAVDTMVMLRWGALMAGTAAKGRPLPVFDSLLAATALTPNMQLVTRNVQDFAETGVQVVNPWQEQGAEGDS